MTKRVKIQIRKTGQSFATRATVKAGRTVLHTTRDYPHGMRASAYGAAKAWAERNGYSVIESGQRL